jgi:PhnB protein
VNITARLIVAEADEAISYYQAALGADLVQRVTDDADRVVAAVLRVGSSTLTLSEHAHEWGWLAPTDLGGSPVLLQADLGDPDAVADRMVAEGGTVIVPIENRPYGRREGRVQDPSGHLWILSGDPR